MDRNVRLISVIILQLLASITCVDSLRWFAKLQMSAIGSKDHSQDLICSDLSKKQKEICRRYSHVMFRVREGVGIGARECVHQFKNQRWNCTTVTGKILTQRGSREAAFAHAISSAGVVHAITRSCSEGELANCECNSEKTGRQIDSKGEFQWGGCSDNVQFGRKFARRFIDAPERNRRDPRALMNLHNNKAGRKAVMKRLTKNCKCHGVSGACTVRTCWVALNDFRKVGNYLKKKYDGSVQVTMINSESPQLVEANPLHKKPTSYDLVYFDSSPDYCHFNRFSGSLGTAGRKCNRDSKGTDGCDIMCCGRGYDTKRTRRTFKCNCKFHWCCDVKCQRCEEYVEEYYCKTQSTRKDRPYYKFLAK